MEGKSTQNKMTDKKQAEEETIDIIGATKKGEVFKNAIEQMKEMSDVTEGSSFSFTCIWLRDLWLTHWVKVVSESVDQVGSSNVDQVGAT